MGDMDAADHRGLMDSFPAVDLPLERIGFTGVLIAAVVVVGLVTAVWITVALRRRARRVPPTVYLPRHPRHVEIRRWWRRNERWNEFVRSSEQPLLPGQDPWRER